MRKSSPLSDASVLAALGDRLARLRLERNLTQAQLAREAGVSKRTLIRLEHGESTQLTNLIRVLRGLGALGNLDALIPPTRTSPIEQLRARAKTRRRASPAARNRRPSTTWAWGDEPPPTGG